MTTETKTSVNYGAKILTRPRTHKMLDWTSSTSKLKVNKKIRHNQNNYRVDVI